MKVEWNRIVEGDARRALAEVPAGSVELVFFSPPYWVGKSWDRMTTFAEWQELLSEVMLLLGERVRPGGFVVVNANDILCFRDSGVPGIRAVRPGARVCPVTREDVEAMRVAHPGAGWEKLGRLLGCSAQTVKRRMEGSDARGVRRSASTRVVLTGEMICDWAKAVGLHLYDRRVWHKDPCWKGSPWHPTTYRAVDEFEYLYVFWKPGPTVHERLRLAPEEWSAWGSRGVWRIRSVVRNGRHEAEFPEELARRVIRLWSGGGEHGGWIRSWEAERRRWLRCAARADAGWGSSAIAGMRHWRGNGWRN